MREPVLKGSPLLRLISMPYVLWLLLVLPGARWRVGYWRETVFYGELIHAWGELSELLIVTLAATPPGLMFHGRAGCAG